MEKITLNQLLTDFFKDGDTVTVSAKELQSLLRNTDNKLRKQEIEINKLNEKIDHLKFKNGVLETKLTDFKIKYNSTYTLDLTI